MRAITLREWDQGRMQSADAGALFRYEDEHYLKIASGKWAMICGSGMSKFAAVYDDFWGGGWDGDTPYTISTIERAPRGYKMTMNGDGQVGWEQATRSYDEGNLVSTTLADAVAFLLGEKQPLHVDGEKVVLVKDE